MQRRLLAGGVHFGKKIITTTVNHPFLIFSLGALAGIYLYKKRHTLLESSDQMQAQPVEKVDND
ncbi:MAG: hypothetical protein ACU83N_06785 [Gammaproteobacteria bacterium]